MLRKKFAPPVAIPNRPVNPRPRDQQPLPERDRTLAALRYHFALHWLDRGCGTLEHFVLLAQHLVVARALGKLGCRGIPERTLAAADEAVTKWTRHGLETGQFRVDIAAFAAIQRFLLVHDEQFEAASSAAVSVALADLREVCNPVHRPPVIPFANRV
jgi:hypothetical protein